eukprot:scaffold24380_cov63-Phaeocystis_antarctica.AAC.4
MVSLLSRKHCVAVVFLGDGQSAIAEHSARAKRVAPEASTCRVHRVLPPPVYAFSPIDTSSGRSSFGSGRKPRASTRTPNARETHVRSMKPHNSSIRWTSLLRRASSRKMLPAPWLAQSPSATGGTNTRRTPTSQAANASGRKMAAMACAPVANRSTFQSGAIRTRSDTIE